MEISSIVIGLILAGISLAYAGLPFRKEQRRRARNVKPQVKKAERREAVLSAIRDLDFDFKTGKISEEDYTPLRVQLLIQAAEVIEDPKTDDKLEAMIQARRASPLKNKCHRCGTELETGQRFCSKCGSTVSQENCPHCGKKTRPGDLFCTGCGTRLEVRAKAVT